MFFIARNLLKIYKNKNIRYIITKSRSCFITKDVVGKTFIVYNGKKWLRKDIDTHYYINKSLCSLRNLETKKISTYKSKKKKTVSKNRK